MWNDINSILNDINWHLELALVASTNELARNHLEAAQESVEKVRELCKKK